MQGKPLSELTFTVLHDNARLIDNADIAGYLGALSPEHEIGIGLHGDDENDGSYVNLTIAGLRFLISQSRSRLPEEMTEALLTNTADEMVFPERREALARHCAFTTISVGHEANPFIGLDPDLLAEFQAHDTADVFDFSFPDWKTIGVVTALCGQLIQLLGSARPSSAVLHGLNERLWPFEAFVGLAPKEPDFLLLLPHLTSSTNRIAKDVPVGGISLTARHAIGMPVLVREALVPPTAVANVIMMFVKFCVFSKRVTPHGDTFGTEDGDSYRVLHKSADAVIDVPYVEIVIEKLPEYGIEAVDPRPSVKVEYNDDGTRKDERLSQRLDQLREEGTPEQLDMNDPIDRAIAERLAVAKSDIEVPAPSDTQFRAPDAVAPTSRRASVPRVPPQRKKSGFSIGAIRNKLRGNGGE